ncbi:MAG: erythromycin esterase [Propionibacteriaceae bacterium]|nr:erythromycin esterase [Propionibacteriaceae bacterium]
MTTTAVDVDDFATPLRDDRDFDPLLDRIADARIVLLGEASHGTSEFYSWRAAVTRRLISERDFSFVAVEGDWPDCYQVARSVQGTPGAPADPGIVLEEFDRWPTWMWANEEVRDFTRWLAGHNQELPADDRVGFYGLDVYSLWDSLRETVGYLREYEPDHVEPALDAIRCLEPYAEDPQLYASSTRLVPSGCEDQVSRLLSELERRRPPETSTDSEARFNAEQNALVAAGAEAYYRAMVRGGPDSWNLRDTHMADTLDRLLTHRSRSRPAKAVVWEHNTHVGDARATRMADSGLINVGQLVRERYGTEEVVLVGFGTHRGTVVAADRWDGRAEVMPVPRAQPHTLEDALHRLVETGGLTSEALLVFPPEPPSWLTVMLDHRAIGVVYHPRWESRGNYVPTRLGHRYDAFCWFDATSALHPLHTPPPRRHEDETWPWGV